MSEKTSSTVLQIKSDMPQAEKKKILSRLREVAAGYTIASNLLCCPGISDFICNTLMRNQAILRYASCICLWISALYQNGRILLQQTLVAATCEEYSNHWRCL